MDFFEFEDENNDILGSVSRFEQMVAERDSYYFDCEEFLDIIEYYLSQGAFDKAQRVVEFGKKQHPYSGELRLLEAQILIANMQYKKALEILSELNVINPSDSDILMALGAVYSKLKMSTKAMKCYFTALETHEFPDEVFYLIASEHQKNLEFEQAIAFYKKSLKENPENDIVLHELNMCYECLNDTDSAIRFYNKYLDNQPYSETAWFNLGGMYSKLEQWDKSVEAYEFALAINPHFSSAYFNKANALASNGKYQEAINAYKETYEYESPNYITYCYIGECYERLENFEKGLKYYNRALSEQQDYPEAWIGKGICLDALGKTSEGYKCIQRGLELTDDEADFWFAAAELEEKLGLIEEAVASMRKAISLDRTDLNLFVDYLRLLDRNFNPEMVLEPLEEALSMHANNPVLLYFKAGISLKMREYSKAYQIFEKALKFDFKGHEAFFENFPQAKKNQNILALIDRYQD